jgi:hypothetical protein
VSDFLTQLRAEVLDAHAAQRRRGRMRRALRTLRGEPRAAMAVATAALALVAVVIAVRAVTTPPAGGPRVVDVIRLGGTPADAVRAGDSVWIADFARRRLIALDVRGRRVDRRVALDARPIAVAAGPGGVWVRTAVGEGGAVQRLGGSASAPVGNGAALAVAPTVVWAADVELPPEGVHRIDAGTGRDSGFVEIPDVYTFATGGRWLWAATGNGTVLRLDGRTGRVRARWPAVALSPGTADPALVADARGAWVLQIGQGAASRAIRLEGDRVVRRIAIPASTLPLLAAGPDGLWVATQDSPRGRLAVVRLDPRSGAVTARVTVDNRNLTDLVAVGEDLWVVAGDGTVTVVGD